MKKLVLVSIHFEDSPQAVPLGAAMLAAGIKKSALLRDRVTPCLRDFYASDDVSGCVEAILSDNPDYVGFSLALWNRGLGINLAAGLAAEALKRGRPDFVLFAGGPEATGDPRGLMRTGLFDFVFRGEAEETLAALLSLLVEGGSRAGNAVSGALSVPVAGVIAAGSWKTGSGRIPEPAFVENLDSLSSPFLDGTLNLPSYGGLLWELSRGCPFGCHFCYESRGKLGVRVFSLERLERELEVFAGAGVAQVYVLDPTFNVNGKRAKNILELIRRKAPSIHFTFEARSEYLDPELAALFSSVSCSVQIGLQSAHPEVLVHVGRNMDRDDFYEKVLLLHEAEVVYGFDLMYGLPGDSLDGFCESLDFALEMRPNHLDIFPLAVLPGTRLAEEASDFGLVWIPGPPYTVLSTPSMNSSDMNEAQKIAEACEQLYNKGGAVAWFSMVTEALSLRPSGLIMEFSAWSGTHRASLFESLRSFVQSLFDRAGKKAQGRVAADIISYFHDTDDPSVLPFYHDPAELGAYLESGIDNIEELLLLVPENPHDTA